MEPITHFLTGACIGRAGLNRKTAYATLAAILAAEAADIDVLWGLAGPVEELKHHRGITHTFLAAPVMAGLAVGAVWLFHRWREKRTQAKSALPFPTMPHLPIHWGWLYGTATFSALSHLLLDWTNNYGLRPFFPFNPRWYAGSFVFIAEPVIWAIFLLAFAMPWLFGLIGGEIGAKKKAFRGQGWAIFALTAIAVLWCVRWAEHAQALAMVENTQIASAPVTRVAIEPYPVNPFRWHAILETENFYQTAEINTHAEIIESDPHRDVLYKPNATLAIEAAKRTPLGQVYLDWGSWAVVRDMGQFPIPGMASPQLGANRAWTTVQFTDLRFDYSFLGTGQAKGQTPLSGAVYIVDNRDEAGEAIGGREQR